MEGACLAPGQMALTTTPGQRDLWNDHRYLCLVLRVYKEGVSFSSTSSTVVQMEICLDDARGDPLKYKPVYPCDFDAAVAPRLSAMKGGRRLPFRGTRAPSADLVGRWILAHS
jgi:hypothetical protein